MYKGFLAELLVMHQGFLEKLLFTYQGFLAELLEKVSRLSRGTSQNVSRVSSWLSLAEPLNFRITPDKSTRSCSISMIMSATDRARLPNKGSIMSWSISNSS